MSPSFLDQYISAARVVSTRAIGNPAPRPASTDLPARARHRPGRARRRSAARHARRTARRASVSRRRRIQAEHRGLADRRLRARHGVSRTRSIVTIDGAKVFQAHDRRRRGHEGDRSAAGAGGRRDQRPVPEHPGQGHGGAAQGRRHVHRRTYAESDEVLYSFRPGAGEERIPKIGSVEISRSVQSDRRRATRRAAQRIFVCRPATTRARSCRARRRFSRRWRAGRSAVRSPSATSRRRSASTARRARTGDFDTAIQRRAAGDSGEPEVPVSRRAARRQRRAPGRIYRISDLELASRLSFFLSGRLRTTSCSTAAEKGKLSDAGGAGGAGAADAGRPAVEVARHQFRVPVAEGARRSTRSIPTPIIFPELRRQPARGVPPARWSCSSTASSARTAASSIC